MPFAQWMLSNVPSVILGLIIVIFSVAVSISGLLIVRHYISHQRRKTHNEIAGPIYATLGVIYAVLLGFVVIIVWQNFDKADSNVASEANRLSQLYGDAFAFEEPFRQQVQLACRNYAKSIVLDEWKELEKGRYSEKTRALFADLGFLYVNYNPKNQKEITFFEESVNKLNDLYELRRLRTSEATTGMHSLLWFVLITGGLVTIAFIYFFGTENFNAQLLMTVLVAILISLLLFTILLLDYPFSGDAKVSSRPFKTICGLTPGDF